MRKDEPVLFPTRGGGVETEMQEDPDRFPVPRGSSKRGIWNWTVGLAGLLYLGITLFADWTSPPFGLMLIALAGYELIAHRGGRQGNGK
jgi:hypothetical protein